MKSRSIIRLPLLSLLLIICAACNNPLHRPYNPATYEEDIQAIRKSNKVSEEDLEILAKYIMLAKLSGNDITGKSYDDIIDKIKSTRQGNDELKTRQAMETESRRQRLSPFLDVNLQGKTFTTKNNKAVLVFTIVLKNTGTQKIKTVTGNLLVNDLMEKPVKSLNIFVDEDILPGHALTKTFTNDYNDADENDRRMRSKDIFDLRMVWNPEKIIFENGKLAE